MNHQQNIIRKRKLTLDQKANIVKIHNENNHMKQDDIARQFNVDRSTISKILSDPTRWLKPSDVNTITSVNQNNFEDVLNKVELNLKLWLREQNLSDRSSCNDNDSSLSDKEYELLVKQKALELFDSFGLKIDQNQNNLLSKQFEEFLNYKIFNPPTTNTPLYSPINNNSSGNGNVYLPFHYFHNDQQFELDDEPIEHLATYSKLLSSRPTSPRSHPYLTTRSRSSSNSSSNHNFRSIKKQSPKLTTNNNNSSNTTSTPPNNRQSNLLDNSSSFVDVFNSSPLEITSSQFRSSPQQTQSYSTSLESYSSINDNFDALSFSPLTNSSTLSYLNKHDTTTLLTDHNHQYISSNNVIDALNLVKNFLNQHLQSTLNDHQPSLINTEDLNHVEDLLSRLKLNFD